jgi:hypothetical protein
VTADILTVLVQVVVGLGGLAGIVSLLTVRAQKRKLISESGKTDAEADAAFSEAYHRRASTQVSLVGPYERVMDRMQEELDEANERIDRLTTYVETLVDIVRGAGLAVPPMPRPPDPPPRRPARRH